MPVNAVIPYDELALAFQARHLAVPMELALSVTTGTRAEHAIDLLAAGNYDQAPVFDGGELAGFVLRSRLELADPAARVSQVMAGIAPGNIVSADAPVGRLLDWIIQPGLLFILDGREFTGFVTVSDFNKQPARAYFYLLMTSLESALAALLRDHFSPDQDHATAALAGNARRRIHGRYETARAENTEADLIAYFDFPDLLAAIGADGELHRRMKSDSPADWLVSTDGLGRLRNDVMHVSRSLVSSKMGLIRIRELEHQARDVLERANAAMTLVEDRANDDTR